MSEAILFIAFGFVATIYAITCTLPLMVIGALSCPLLGRDIFLIETYRFYHDSDKQCCVICLVNCLGILLGAHILRHLRVRGFWLLRTYALVLADGQK